MICRALTPLAALLLTAAPAWAEVPRASATMSKAEMRERLSACATQWQQMKRNGTDGSLIWRDFSKDCMTRAAQPGPQKENASPVR